MKVKFNKSLSFTNLKKEGYLKEEAKKNAEGDVEEELEQKENKTKKDKVPKKEKKTDIKIILVFQPPC